MSKSWRSGLSMNRSAPNQNHQSSIPNHQFGSPVEDVELDAPNIPDHMNSPLLAAILVGFLACGPASAATAADDQLFARSNLVAWCIVPFDARKRSPQGRPAMPYQRGSHPFAYD